MTLKVLKSDSNSTLNIWIPEFDSSKIHMEVDKNVTQHYAFILRNTLILGGSYSDYVQIRTHQRPSGKH